MPLWSCSGQAATRPKLSSHQTSGRPSSSSSSSPGSIFRPFRDTTVRMWAAALKASGPPPGRSSPGGSRPVPPVSQEGAPTAGASRHHEAGPEKGQALSPDRAVNGHHVRTGWPNTCPTAGLHRPSWHTEGGRAGHTPLRGLEWPSGHPWWARRTLGPGYLGEARVCLLQEGWWM